jgi:site-specific DNA recombinase
VLRSSPVDAVIYTRVSRDSAGGRSVEDQERECRQECERSGWPVRAVYCDNSIGASRYSGDRPEWRRLKRDLRKGDVLVVWEASRAQRDLQEWVELRSLCAELQVPLSYAGRVLDLTLGDDRFTGGLDALVAEYESERIRTRVLRGKRASAADGRPMSRPPWGYRATREIDAQGRSRPQWELDPAEVPRVREAVERLLAGETQYSVLEWLKATEGYAPTTPTTLRRALLNPALAGLRQHQGQVVGKASWPAMITKEQHEQLKSRDRRMRAMYGYNSQPGPEPKYLLSGIAKCGVCGDGLGYRAKEGRKPFYACQKGHVSRLADMLDKAVGAAIFKRLSGVDPSDYESDDADDSAVIADIEELDQQLAEWEAEAIAGRVSPGAFGRAERELTARIEALRAKIETPSELELDPTQWPELTMAERRHIVRSLFEVVVPKLGRRVRALPGDVAITPL